MDAENNRAWVAILKMQHLDISEAGLCAASEAQLREPAPSSGS